MLSFHQNRMKEKKKKRRKMTIFKQIQSLRPVVEQPSPSTTEVVVPVVSEENLEQTARCDVTRVVSFGRDRRGFCSWFGNFLWLVLGGWHQFLSWMVIGVALCATLIGMPCGVQCFKIALFVLFLFGKQATYYTNCREAENRQENSRRRRCCCSTTSTCSCLLNILWAIVVG